MCLWSNKHPFYASVRYPSPTLSVDGLIIWRVDLGTPQVLLLMTPRYPPSKLHMTSGVQGQPRTILMLIKLMFLQGLTVEARKHHLALLMDWVFCCCDWARPEKWSLTLHSCRARIAVHPHVAGGNHSCWTRYCLQRVRVSLSVTARDIRSVTSRPSRKGNWSDNSSLVSSWCPLILNWESQLQHHYALLALQSICSLLVGDIWPIIALVM